MLHRRIDPAIDLVCRPPTKSKIKIRSTRHTLNKESAKIPKQAPIWTLSREALEHLNWENRTIPNYDPTDDDDDDDDDDDNDEDDNNEVGTSNRKRKRKGKEKERKNKKSKKNKKDKKDKKNKKNKKNKKK